jgi:hypothetical protein
MLVGCSSSRHNMVSISPYRADTPYGFNSKNTSILLISSSEVRKQPRKFASQAQTCKKKSVETCKDA